MSISYKLSIFDTFTWRRKKSKKK